MKYIYYMDRGRLLPVGIKTLDVMSDKWDILCPNLADWLYNERPCYENFI